jgi:hypothetical protein
MRPLLVCIALALGTPVCRADPDIDRVKEHFKSDNYTVTWGTARTLDSGAELDIGHGSGHGCTLGWMRFRPGKDQVDVLRIELDEGRESYKSKWPPDRAPLTIEHARMSSDDYAVLLRDVAVIDAAELKPVQRDSSTQTYLDFWVHAGVTANKKMLVDLDWAGYEGSLAEIEFAKPQAAVERALEAVKGLDFKEHTLTEEERSWASAKFARDWKKFKGLEFHWWVRERYIITIGVVGDASALPALKDAMEGDPKNRCVYYAINAVTRLTKKDVREKPIEEMDVEKTRKRILELLRDMK